jgi:hypothetical protein
MTIREIDLQGCEAVEAVPHERLVRVFYELRRKKGWRLIHYSPGGSAAFISVVNASDPYPTLAICREANKWYCDRMIAEIEERERRFGHRITVELRSADPLADAKLEPIEEGLIVFEPKWL